MRQTLHRLKNNASRSTSSCFRSSVSRNIGRKTVSFRNAFKPPHLIRSKTLSSANSIYSVTYELNYYKPKLIEIVTNTYNSYQLTPYQTEQAHYTVIHVLTLVYHKVKYFYNSAV
mgnify:CR=1 FL=1